MCLHCWIVCSLLQSITRPPNWIYHCLTLPSENNYDCSATGSKAAEVFWFSALNYQSPTKKTMTVFTRVTLDVPKVEILCTKVFLETSDIMNKCQWFIHLMNHDSFGIMIGGYLQPVKSNSREFTYFWGWNPGDSVLPSELIPAVWRKQNTTNI